MFSKDKYKVTYKAHMVPPIRRQVEILENWCKDFGGFFGWRVNVSKKEIRMIVELIANKCIYRFSAEDGYLWCLHNDRESGRSRHLTGGEFSFGTFAQIMIQILHLESSARRSKYKPSQKSI